MIEPLPVMVIGVPPGHVAEVPPGPVVFGVGVFGAGASAPPLIDFNNFSFVIKRILCFPMLALVDHTSWHGFYCSAAGLPHLLRFFVTRMEGFFFHPCLTNFHDYLPVRSALRDCQYRFNHPFPNLASVLQHIGFQRHAGFQVLRLTVSGYALLIESDLDAVERFVAVESLDILLSVGQDRAG